MLAWQFLSLTSSDEGHLLGDLLWPSVTYSVLPESGGVVGSVPASLLGSPYVGSDLEEGVGGQISEWFLSVAAAQLLHQGVDGSNVEDKFATKMWL